MESSQEQIVALSMKTLFWLHREVHQTPADQVVKYSFCVISTTTIEVSIHRVTELTFRIWYSKLHHFSSYQCCYYHTTELGDRSSNTLSSRELNIYLNSQHRGE